MYRTIDLSFDEDSRQSYDKTNYDNPPLDDFSAPVTFSRAILPNHFESKSRNNKEHILNPNIYKDQPTFYEMSSRDDLWKKMWGGEEKKEKNPSPSHSPSPSFYYAFDDPRLIDASRNIMTFLDAKPFGQRGIITHDEIYAPNNAGDKYKHYDDLVYGNIVYRTKVGEGSEPFNNPNYVIRAGIKYNLLKTPMDNVQREYTRVPFSRDKCPDDSRLEFTRETISHREDIMMTQANKMNSKDWSFRFKQPSKQI